MAINLPIVTQFSDKGIKSAKAAFANFKTDVGTRLARWASLRLDPTRLSAQ